MAEIVKDNERHRVVMTAIIYNEEGKYLIIKRSPNKKVFPNKWTVPGGGLEPQEDYLDTQKTTKDAWYFVVEKVIKREVMEEVNVEIEKPKYLLDLVFIRPDGIPVLTLSYYAKYKTGDVVLEEGDSTEYKWITAEEAKDLDMISGIAGEIEMVDRIIKGENDPKVDFSIF